MSRIKKLSVFFVFCFVCLFFACSRTQGTIEVKEDLMKDQKDQQWKKQAAEMVKTQIEYRGVNDARVLKVMRETPRHLFVPTGERQMAYGDYPLPIGEGQTISQPYIVALMTELLELKGHERILEIGTGSGYQAAVLAQLAKDVFTIEILCTLADQAKERLKAMKYQNVQVRCGDGYLGWPDEAPFDGIVVTAAPDTVPKELVRQLKVGGRMVVPVGDYFQELKVIVKKSEKETQETNVIPVRFVPMVHGQ